MKNKVYIYITPFFPTSMSWRGAYGYDFVKALTRQLELKVEDGKWKVAVFKPGDGADYEVGGITVRTFKTRQLPSNVLPFMFRKYNERSFIDKVKAVGEVEDWKIEDVAICHGNTATFAIYPLAIKQLNPTCKVLLHHHDLQSFGLNDGRLRHCWLYNLYLFPVLRKLHEQIDKHVFISEASHKSFLAAPDANWTVYENYKKQMRGLPYRPAKIKDSVILHNGVDKSIFNVEGRTKSVEREDEWFVIGCVGNFEKLKDQMTLLRAVAILKLEGRMLRVRFVGSGPYLEECKRYAKEHNIDAEFLTEMRHEQLPDFYRGLDLFVLPSYFEGFGCVFTEAHSSGVPFITCEGQGADDIIPIEDKHKWLCEQRNPEDLAKKINMYMDNRYEQRLCEDQNIDILVKKFINKIISL